jgi:hypothetical protein
MMLMSLQVENKVVAVDLSAWLMQAQSQPALLEHYDSPYARAAKVVFDRVSRHRCWGRTCNAEFTPKQRLLHNAPDPAACLGTRQILKRTTVTTQRCQMALVQHL